MSFHSLDKIYTSYVKRFNQSFRGSEEFGNMTLNMYDYIWLVYQRGETTATEIAAELGVKKPSVSAMVETLEENGYFQKIPSETDKRVSRLRLTPKARELVGREDAFYSAYLAGLEQYLSGDEVKTFDALLDKIAKGLRDEQK